MMIDLKLLWDTKVDPTKGSLAFWGGEKPGGRLFREHMQIVVTWWDEDLSLCVAEGPTLKTISTMFRYLAKQFPDGWEIVEDRVVSVKHEERRQENDKPLE